MAIKDKKKFVAFFLPYNFLIFQFLFIKNLGLDLNLSKRQELPVDPYSINKLWIRWPGYIAAAGFFSFFLGRAQVWVKFSISRA